MTLYRSHNRGSLILERKFRGLPKIRKATGCRDTPEGRRLAGKYEDMLEHLATDGGRRDLVRAVALGDLEMQDLWPPYVRGKWRELPGPEELARAFPVGPQPGAPRRGKTLGAVGRWLPTYRTSKGTISSSHAHRMWQCLHRVELLNPKARVADLPGLVRRYRGICEHSGNHRDFQLVKAAVQTFLRSTLGRRRSHLWAEVADTPTLRPGEGESTRRAGRTFTPAQAREIRGKLGGRHGQQWWALCTTGMMPDEYFGRKWTDHEDRLEVTGTKRRTGAGDAKGRRWREIPRLGPIVGPFTEHEAFQEALRALGADVFGANVVPYDARHTYAHWLVQAGIDPATRDVYRGHSAKTMADLYERPDRVASVLAAHAELLAAYIGPEPAGEGFLAVVRGKGA